jgi:hypothetical protein
MKLGYPHKNLQKMVRTFHKTDKTYQEWKYSHHMGDSNLQRKGNDYS